VPMPPPPGVRGFVPTVKFEGTKAGLRYRMGPSGLGYYPEGSGPNDASSSFWDLGFRVLPSVFTPDVVDGMQRQIVDYIRGNGSRVSTNLLDRKGGWYFADFASEPRLANIFDQLHKSPKLRAALTELLGGSPDSFRVLTRNEIYCDWGRRLLCEVKRAIWSCSTRGSFTLASRPSMRIGIATHPADMQTSALS